MLLGAMLLKPTSIFPLASALGVVWLFIQARLEEIDLLQRMPEYREYMKKVPRFLPRISARNTDVTGDDPRGKFA